MRSTSWVALLLAAVAQAQNTATVSICNSYSYTGTITFIEYSTIYAGIGATRLRTATTTLGTSTSTSGLSTTNGVSNSGVLTSRSTTTSHITTFSRASTDNVPGNGTSLLIPGQDTIAPDTPIPTSSTSSTACTSSTGSTNSVSSMESTTKTTGSTSPVVSTAPTATDGEFYISFYVLGQTRAVEYLAFDATSQSVLVTAGKDAQAFQLDVDGSLITGNDSSQYVAVDNEQPPRFMLQATKPDIAVTVTINSDGTVTILGVTGYCMLQGGDLVVSTDDQLPTECQLVLPDLLPVPGSSITTTSTISKTESTSMSSTLTTTSSDTTSVTAEPISSTTEATSSTTEASSTTFDPSTTESSTTGPTTSSIITTTTSSASTTTSSGQPVVTDQAYIDTILRHHNYHRQNHSAPALTWSDSLAATAKKIGDSCVYAHDTTTDGGGYGQNIGAGYLPVQMGYLISNGFYNGEVNSYTYFGGEPDYNTLHQWGHFSQVVWVDTQEVGCYTSDCTASGLGNVDASTGIRPYFTVCNYALPGNYVGEFAANVLPSTGLSTIHAGYDCPTDENCVDGSI